MDKICWSRFVWYIGLLFGSVAEARSAKSYATVDSVQSTSKPGSSRSKAYVELAP